MAEEGGYEVLLSTLRKIDSCNHSSIKGIFKPSFMAKLARLITAESIGIKKGNHDP